MRGTNIIRICGTLLIAAAVVLGGRTVSAQAGAATNAAAPQAQASTIEPSKTGSSIELFVDYSDESFAEEATLKELTSMLRDSVKAELEAGDFKVTLINASATAAANAPYLLKVRLIDYRTIGVQRAIYARYELIGGGKIVKQKLTQSTVKSAFQLPKALAAQIANIVRDRVRGVPAGGKGKTP